MGKYAQVLERRSSLPRREYIHDRLRGNLQKQEVHRSHLVAVRNEVTAALNELKTEYKELQEQLDLYKHPTNVLIMFARHETLPTAAGVYAIFVRDIPVYVGESVNVQNRALDHLKIVLNPTLSPKRGCLQSLYDFLGRQPHDVIECRLLEEILPPATKTTRLRREGHWCNTFIAEGHTLFNTNWVNRVSKKPDDHFVADLNLVNKIDKRSTSDDLHERIIVSKERWDGLRLVLSDEVLIQHFALRHGKDKVIMKKRKR